MVILPEEMERADTPSLVLARALQRSGEFAESGAVVNGGQSIIKTLIDFLRDSGTAKQAGHSTAHSLPLQLILRAPCNGSVDFETLHVLGGSFPAESGGDRGGGIAVPVQRIPPHPVFHPVAGDATLEVHRQLPSEMGRDLSVNIHA